MKKFLSGKRVKYLFTLTMLCMLLVGTGVVSHASDDLTVDPATYTAKSLLTTEASNIVTNFGANVLLTVTAVIVLCVGVGLTIWGLKYGVFTGINWIKRYAKGRA